MEHIIPMQICILLVLDIPLNNSESI